MIADQRPLENGIIRYELPLCEIFLTKPFNPKELLAFVRRMVQGGREE